MIGCIIVLSACTITLFEDASLEYEKKPHYNSQNSQICFICCFIGVLTRLYNELRTVYQELRLF